MNPYTKDEVKTAKALAHNFVFSDYNILTKFPKQFKFDKRTRIGNLANVYVNNLRSNVKNLERVKKLKIKRRESRKNQEFTSLLSLPIVRDYLNNKSNLKSISDNGLHFFNGRNHYAKTEKDFKIIKILKKHFINK